MKILSPRHKRLKREGRLQVAKHWIPQYNGKNIVKGYSKHFGVNIVCSALELQILGYEMPEHYFEQLKADEIRKQKKSEQKKYMEELRRQVDRLEDSDGTFYYIAGYTSNGFPYGITWNQLEDHHNIADNEEDESEEVFK